MRRIPVLLHLPLGLILSLPWLLITYIASKFSRPVSRKMAYGFIYPYGVLLMKFCGARYHIEGKEHIDESINYLVVANHRSLLDTPTLVTLFKKPLSFVSKMEMKKVPILGQWMPLFGCLFLNRESNREGLKTILQGIENLKAGEHLAIFPQGTRSEGDTFLPMKAGSFKLATKSEKPILPVAIYGTDDLLENNTFNVTAADVYIKIFPPIPTKGMSKEEQKDLPGKINDMIEAQYNRFKEEV